MKSNSTVIFKKKNVHSVFIKQMKTRGCNNSTIKWLITYVFFMFHTKALVSGKLAFTQNHEPVIKHCQVSSPVQQFARISQKMKIKISC